MSNRSIEVPVELLAIQKNAPVRTALLN